MMLSATTGNAGAGEPRSLIGSTIQGRYRVLTTLGSGGMGTVYLGEHLMIRRKVAIKTMLEGAIGSEERIERFRREALAATKVGSDHIVEVLDMGYLDTGALFMVMEYLEGQDFAKQIARQGPQPVGRLARIMVQMCDALDAVHAHNIVHRDLKPENMFLVRRGDTPDFVKVLDFGVSKFRRDSDTAISQVTSTGAMVGTPAFMSPEQTQGVSDVDHRTDIYALGAIMYYALTGARPFEGSNLPMLFVKICTERPRPLQDYRADIDPALDAIVQRALGKQREDRYSSCADLKRALMPFTEHTGGFETVVMNPATPSDPIPSLLREFANRESEGALPRTLANPDVEVLVEHEPASSTEAEPFLLMRRRPRPFEEASDSVPSADEISRRRPRWLVGAGLVGVVALLIGVAAWLRGAPQEGGEAPRSEVHRAQPAARIDPPQGPSEVNEPAEAPIPDSEPATDPSEQDPPAAAWRAAKVSRGVQATDGDRGVGQRPSEAEPEPSPVQDDARSGESESQGVFPDTESSPPEIPSAGVQQAQARSGEEQSGRSDAAPERPHKTAESTDPLLESQSRGLKRPHF